MENYDNNFDKNKVMLLFNYLRDGCQGEEEWFTAWSIDLLKHFGLPNNYNFDFIIDKINGYLKAKEALEKATKLNDILINYILTNEI